ncbi:hypothetical protein ACF8OI_06320 [Aeromonas bivalvium]|uniref:hypothetical protein n=1 Tax=Aeromonas bivalvium TaxID=440079 RepID=UPI00370A9625
MNIKSIVMLSTLLLLSGCVSMMGNTRNKSESIGTFHDISTAARDTSPILEISKDDFKNINIDKDVSPTIIREDRVEYFEIVELTGKENSDFSLTIASLCDCIGFRKWAVLAEPFMFGPDGSPVEMKKGGTPEAQTLTGSFPKSGAYKLLIIANTKYLDQQMGNIHGYWDYSNSASGFTLPLRVHQTGLVQVVWNK